MECKRRAWWGVMMVAMMVMTIRMILTTIMMMMMMTIMIILMTTRRAWWGDHYGQDPLDANDDHAGEHCQNNDIYSMNDDHQLSKVVTS